MRVCVCVCVLCVCCVCLLCTKSPTCLPPYTCLHSAFCNSTHTIAFCLRPCIHPAPNYSLASPRPCLHALSSPCGPVTPPLRALSVLSLRHTTHANAACTRSVLASARSGWHSWRACSRYALGPTTHMARAHAHGLTLTHSRHADILRTHAYRHTKDTRTRSLHAHTRMHACMHTHSLTHAH